MIVSFPFLVGPSSYSWWNYKDASKYQMREFKGECHFCLSSISQLQYAALAQGLCISEEL